MMIDDVTMVVIHDGTLCLFHFGNDDLHHIKSSAVIHFRSIELYNMGFLSDPKWSGTSDTILS